MLAGCCARLPVTVMRVGALGSFCACAAAWCEAAASTLKASRGAHPNLRAAALRVDRLVVFDAIACSSRWQVGIGSVAPGGDDRG
jgi:hypothetical protein